METTLSIDVYLSIVEDYRKSLKALAEAAPDGIHGEGFDEDKFFDAQVEGMSVQKLLEITSLVTHGDLKLHHAIGGAGTSVLRVSGMSNFFSGTLKLEWDKSLQELFWIYATHKRVFVKDRDISIPLRHMLCAASDSIDREMDRVRGVQIDVDSTQERLEIEAKKKLSAGAKRPSSLASPAALGDSLGLPHR